MFSAEGSEGASDNSQSFDALDEDILDAHGINHDHITINGSSIFDQTPWYKMPEMSLLDLAYKLKQAEMRIFGRDKRYADKKEVEMSNSSCEEAKEIRLNSDLYFGIEPSAKRALLEINEKYRQLEASFPRNLTGEEMPSKLVGSLGICTADQVKVMENKVKKRFGCGWCGYNTDSKSHLHRHHKSMHRDRELKILTDPDLFIPPKKSHPTEGKRKHQCDMCNYQTDCKSHLRRHQGSVHCKDKLYECSICKVEFSRSEKAKEHHFAFHPEKAFDIRNMRKPPSDNLTSRSSNFDKIEKIRQLYEDADQLLKLRKAESLLKNSHCSILMNLSDEQICDDLREFRQTNGIKINTSMWTDCIQDERDEADGKKAKLRNNSFVCLKCDYSCRDLWHLRRHVLDVHSSHKDHNCKVCHYATNRHHRLYCHMLKHGELFCNFCEFSSTNPDAYKLHFQVCSVIQKMTKCSVCSRDFEDFATYKGHVVSEHRDLIVTCPKCQFFTESSTELQTHLGLHVWEDKICKICHFMAESEEAFSQHCCDCHLTYDSDWTHKWTCSECGKTEGDRDLAVAHMASHPGVVHECQEAGCSFCCHTDLCMELHLKYMHQSEDDKSSLVAYINQLDAEMSENLPGAESKTDETQSEEMKVDSNLDPLSNPEMDENIETVEDDQLIPTETIDNHVSSNLVCLNQPSELSFPYFSPAAPDEELLIVNPTTSVAGHSLGFSCLHCPDRPPFRYKKSFDKHMTQHELEEENKENGDDDGVK